MIKAKKRIAIIGAGLSGATIAHHLAENGYYVNVFEQRNHVGGNVHSYRDEQTGVMVHAYGPHIFHTDDFKIWEWFNRFANFVPYTQRTKGLREGSVYSLPINLHTINQFFGKQFNPAEAQGYIARLAESASRSIGEPKNFEQKALSLVGRDLYSAFLRDYTMKQWGMHPTEVPAYILSRLPLRFNYDDNAFYHDYQGLPKQGYTRAVERMLDYSGISVTLNHKFEPDTNEERNYDHIFNTGPIDEWFWHCEGALRYRTLDIIQERSDLDDKQGCTVLNSCDLSTPWTRSTEHKHFTPWWKTSGTIVTKEFSRDYRPGTADIPYYPIRLQEDLDRLARYQQRAAKHSNWTFVGRLGTYQYLDMDKTIAQALDAAKLFVLRDSVA